MNKIYKIELNDFDLGQLIDGLEVRARAWQDTADYLRADKEPPKIFSPEECNDAQEAEKIFKHYERIIDEILRQRKAQDNASLG